MYRDIRLNQPETIQATFNKYDYDRVLDNIRNIDNYYPVINIGNTNYTLTNIVDRLRAFDIEEEADEEIGRSEF